MKRVVILAISFIALVFCFTSCGEKKLDPNFLPHDSNIELTTNLADMVKKEKKYKTAKTLDDEMKREYDYLEEYYEIKNVEVNQVKFDYIAYFTCKGFDPNEIFISYRTDRNVKNSEYMKICDFCTKRYGESVPEKKKKSRVRSVIPKRTLGTLE